MAEKYYYYIDYGSGDVNINPHDNNLELSWIRGELNDFIARKKLTGTFALIDSEAVAAESYYIGLGNIEAPIKIYENGDSISGTLIYEGWATTEGIFDYDDSGNAISCTFNSFRTNDKYTNLIKYWNESIKFRDIQLASSTPIGYNSNVRSQSLFENINNTIDSLDCYTWNGTNFITTGNSLSTGNIGRIAGVAASTAGGGGVFYIDNYTHTLRSKQYIAPNWTTLYPEYVVVSSLVYGNWAILSTSSTSCYVVNETGAFYQLDVVGGVWTETSFNFYSNLLGRYPSICLVDPTSYTFPLWAYINDETKVLQAYLLTTAYGEGFDLSGVSKPKICGLDYTSGTIAIVDESTKLLRALQFNYPTGSWTELGSIQVNSNIEPEICYSSANVINFHDSQTGLTEKYTFTPATNIWAITGSTTTIGNADDGYSTVFVTVDNTATEQIAFIKSGSMVLIDSGTKSIQNYINSIIDHVTLRDSLSTFPCLIPDTGSGSDLDLSKLALSNAEQTADNIIDRIELNDYENNYTLKDIIQIIELFQQYFYLETSADPLIDYDILFTQPDQFSSFGTDIVVDSYSSSLLRSRLYNENFKINYEKLKFKNEFNTDFIGSDIIYDRSNDTELVNNYNITTDFRNYKQNELGILNNFDKSGFLMYLTETGINFIGIVSANTVFGGTSYIENSDLSKARIHDTYYKDYRYSNKGNIIINGTINDASTFNTIRESIIFPDYQTYLENFPSDIGNLDWGAYGKSFITKLSTRLETATTTISSRVLDLFSTEFRAVYNEWTEKPSYNMAIKMDAMVRGWVSSGVWDKSDRIFVFAIHTNNNGESLIDWKNPTGTAATMVNNPIFTPFEGFTGDGATKYINSNYNPVIDGINYTLNNGSIGAYSRTNNNEVAALTGSVSSGSVSQVAYDNLNIYGEINTSAFAFTPVANSLGWVIASRETSALQTLYQNKTLVLTNTSIPISIPNYNNFILARNLVGSPNLFSTKQISFVTYGGGLNQTEIDSLFDYSEAYMDSNGKGVI